MLRGTTLGDAFAYGCSCKSNGCWFFKVMVHKVVHWERYDPFLFRSMLSEGTVAVFCFLIFWRSQISFTMRMGLAEYKLNASDR